MATKADVGANGCTFLWRIENINRCSWFKTTSRIKSPTLIADTVKNTKWKLWLFPMGSVDDNYISIGLYRDEDSIGPFIIEVNIDFAILGTDGSLLKGEPLSKSSFKIGGNIGCKRFVTREKVFVTGRETFLPEDVLTIQCTIWTEEVKPVETELTSARTIFEVDRRSCVKRISKFSKFESDQKYKFKDVSIDFDLSLKKLEPNWENYETNLVININSFKDSVNFFSLKIFILDFEEEIKNCGTFGFYTVQMQRGTLSTSFTQVAKMLMENKSRYLPNDVFSLHCEYIVWTKTVVYENFDSRKLFPGSKVGDVEKENEQYVEKLEFHNTPALMDDLKSMYNDAAFCDMELRTSTHTFPVHKAILSARSPVFGRMFSNDMKEKNSGHVNIVDLKDSTIRRMLLYIYTDSLQNLQVESALDLYAAANKYQILSLKSRCSSFLKDNLCRTNVCDILILADLYQDIDLNNFVQDYILEHEKEVFSSKEWKDFIDTNSKLAAKVMHRRFFLE